MLMLTRRLQVLLDEPRYRRLATAAKERKTSVAVLVREAIDASFPADRARKRAAARRILAAEPMPVPATVEELKAELSEARSGLS